MSRLSRFIARNNKRRPRNKVTYLYMGDVPIAILNSNDFNVEDITDMASIVINEKPTFDFTITVSGYIPFEVPDYSDLESTLNTLGIPLESDLENEDDED